MSRLPIRTLLVTRRRAGVPLETARRFASVLLRFAGMARGRDPLRRWLRGRARGMVLVLAFVGTGAGCMTASDPEGAVPPVGAESARARSPLPTFERGARMSDVQARLADWPPGHRYSSDTAPIEGWEWTGPDGMRVEGHFRGGLALWMSVSRTWGTGTPPVDARKLPDGFIGSRREALETAVGPGLLIERTWTQGSVPGDEAIRETYKWEIHDRGVDTGLFLTVSVRDGVVIGVDHPWTRT